MRKKAVLLPGTRIIQSKQNVLDNTYTVFNNKLKNSIEVGAIYAKLLELTGECGINKLMYGALGRKFFRMLKDNGFICDSQDEPNKLVPLFVKRNTDLPLTSLSIELANLCNLKCVHCYGNYGLESTPMYMPTEWIDNNIETFYKLNVRRIALTGGETTLHPDFLHIVENLLYRGFELCVFTNGLNYQKIQELMEKTKKYKFIVKVSLDGSEYIHNKIRGNSNAYNVTINTIEEIYRHKNVKLYISTTVMKDNIDYMNEFNTYIREMFPSAIHTNDLVFPNDVNGQCSFQLKELYEVNKRFPYLFNEGKSHSMVERHKTVSRCSGGISQATISPDGSMKICNAAVADIFKFEYNVFDKGLEYVWTNGGDIIEMFRNEKSHKTIDCISCGYREKCSITDCRMLAYAYYNRIDRSNPITCITTKNRYGGER